MTIDSVNFANPYLPGYGASAVNTVPSAASAPSSLSFKGAAQPAYDTYDGSSQSYDPPKKGNTLLYVLGSLAVITGGIILYKKGKLDCVKNLFKKGADASKGAGKEGANAGEAAAAKFGRAIEVKMGDVKQLSKLRAEYLETIKTQVNAEKQLNTLNRLGIKAKSSLTPNQTKALEKAGIEISSLTDDAGKVTKDGVDALRKELTKTKTDTGETLKALDKSIKGLLGSTGGKVEFVQNGEIITEEAAKKLIAKGDTVGYALKGKVYSAAENKTMHEVLAKDCGAYTNLITEKGGKEVVNSKEAKALAKALKEAAKSLKDGGTLSSEAAEQHRAAQHLIALHSKNAGDYGVTKAFNELHGVIKTNSTNAGAVVRAEKLLEKIKGLKESDIKVSTISSEVEAQIAKFKDLYKGRSDKTLTEAQARLKELVEQLTEAIS